MVAIMITTLPVNLSSVYITALRLILIPNSLGNIATSQAACTLRRGLQVILTGVSRGSNLLLSYEVYRSPPSVKYCLGLDCVHCTDDISPRISIVSFRHNPRLQQDLRRAMSINRKTNPMLKGRWRQLWPSWATLLRSRPAIAQIATYAHG